MTIEEKKLLLDIKDAIVSVDEHLEGRRDFEEYEKSKTKRRAVERELEIMGEAMNNLLKLNPAIAITHTRGLVNLRNRIIHAYDFVDNTIIWKILLDDLPLILNEVDALLAE